MEFKLMMNENVMIGTAILSTFADKKQSDSIDLMIPFVKYALQEKYAVGDIISPCSICDYIQQTFAFNDLPIAIIEKAIKRLSKNNGCLTYTNKEYTFSKDVMDDHSKIKDKRSHAFMLIESIIKKLTPYINSKSFKKFTEEDSKKALFIFLDKYGLSTINNSLEDQTQLFKGENTNRIIGSFILEEYKEDSEVFKSLIELVKGVFISKALYLQTNNDCQFNARMKNTVIILDAPLLLRVLGLKTAGENRTAKEFLQMLPPEIKLCYFDHNFKELDSIIRSYKYQRISGGKYTHTLEYFDEKASSIEDIDLFLLQLEKKLRSLNITEYSKDIPLIVESFIDIDGLSSVLREKIPSYKNKESALETDVKTISYISRLRGDGSANTIEKCKFIFVTNNGNLVRVTNSFCTNKNDVGYVMTEVDFTVLMWLKNRRKNNDIPKDILVANALAATEEVTENFMEGVLSRIKKYQEDGSFDEETAGLILENIYIRRELVDLCNGDPSELSPEKLQILQTKYEDMIIKKVGFDNKELQVKLESERREKLKIEQEKKLLLSGLRDKAIKKATKSSKIVKWLILSFLILTFISVGIFGIYACITQGLKGEVSIWGIIGIAFSALGIFDFLISKFRLIIRFPNFIEKIVYNKVYDKKIKEYYE